MSDDEIIKKRLIIDGDGTGEDRRLNTLLKQFLKWTSTKNDTPENNQMIYDRILAQAAQCELAAAKTKFTSEMIEEELKNYGKLSGQIEKSIDLAKQEIEECKKELVLAKQIRKNKMEYDMLAKVIKEEPDRKEITEKIETLKKELHELIEKKIKMERKFQKRRNDFSLLMHAIRELEAQLEESSSDEEDKNEIEDGEEIGQKAAGKDSITSNRAAMDISDDDDDDDTPTTSQSTKKRTFRQGEKDSKPNSVDSDEEGSKEAMLVDEDAVLELSLDKDEQEVHEVNIKG